MEVQESGRLEGWKGGSVKKYKSIDDIPEWIWERAITPVGGQVDD